MIRHKHIILRLLLVVIPVLMAMTPAMAQMTVYASQSSELNVVEVPGDTYAWELYNEVTGVNFAVIPGNCPAGDAFFTGGINTGSTVNVTWLTPGIYFYKVTANRAGCTMNLKVGKMTVLETLPNAALLQPPPICIGDTATINISLIGTAPWTIDFNDGTNTITYNNITANPFAISISPTVTTSYTVTRVSDANGENLNPSNMVTLVVKPRPVTSPIIQYGP